MTQAKTAAIVNPYGFYDEVCREYVILRPDTPTPWINYLGEGRYGGIVSNTAGGYSFDRDPRNRRVTRYRYNSIPADQPGRYVYLRDQVTGEYWSPTWQPVPSCTLEAYSCRHGAGYTQISSTFKGIKADLLYFVPPSEGSRFYPCEIWRLTVHNLSDHTRRLRSFSYTEFSYWDAPTDQTNLDWAMHILSSSYQDGTIFTSTCFRPTFTFFTSNPPPAGFDTDREIFIGRSRDLSNPWVVTSGQSLQSQAPRGNNIGSLCHELILEPGEEKTIIYLLGILDGEPSVRPQLIQPLKDQFLSNSGVETAFLKLAHNWSSFLDAFTVQTPDTEMNAMLNFWNAVQCRTNLYWSRFISAYDTGLGRGMGTRDSAQDTLATVHNLPLQARDTLTMLWGLQFNDGHCWHQIFPLTGEGGPGLAGEFPTWPQWFSDDHLWLVMAVCAYLRETSESSYLDQVIPFQDGGAGSVWEHIERAVDFTLNHRGPHGLPRLGFSDWDDTMNLDHGSGKAESVWCGQMFCRIMLDLADLCQHLHKPDEVEYFQGLKHEMAQIVEASAWDGAWYARAFDDDGLPIGVSSETKHRIALNSQTWSVIGDVGSPERQSQAMQSAHEMLNTQWGLRLMWPPYNGSDQRVRGTSTYPPDAKENGNIFCHANNWAIVAAAMLGQSDRAYLYYRQFLPLARTDADVYLVEPYIYCQNICGPLHPQYGMGRNSWLTGTAAWAYVAATQWILGIRPTFNGLQIAPSIPENWKGFSAKRNFRNVTYSIDVSRVGPGSDVAIFVDGRQLEGNIIPLPGEFIHESKIDVSLGKT